MSQKIPNSAPIGSRPTPPPDLQICCGRPSGASFECCGEPIHVAQTPLTVEIVNHVLVIKIGIDTLAGCAQRHPDLYNDLGNERLIVTDQAVFANEVLCGLHKEEEDGSTPVHRMLDKVILYAIEYGAEGCSLDGEEP